VAKVCGKTVGRIRGSFCKEISRVKPALCGAQAPLVVSCNLLRSGAKAVFTMECRRRSNHGRSSDSGEWIRVNLAQVAARADAAESKRSRGGGEWDGECSERCASRRLEFQSPRLH
jgi:hypothetical protein